MKNENVFTPQRWGLNVKAIKKLTSNLLKFWSDFRDCFKSKTRDTSEYSYIYIQGLLKMFGKRNCLNISRTIIDHNDDGQSLQHFISESPWCGKKVFEEIQHDIIKKPSLHGGILSVDESGDKKSGSKSAGASNQYIGNLGKVEMCQNGVFLGYYKKGLWTMIDSELYLPKVWFKKDKAKQRESLHIPSEMIFQTKPEQAFEMVKKAKKRGVPFKVVTGDSVYGKDEKFRIALEKEKILYVLDVPSDTLVYLEKPEIGVPTTPPDKFGRPLSKPVVLSNHKRIKVSSLVKNGNINFKRVFIRQTERGPLSYQCYVQKVWLFSKKGKLREERLLVRKEEDGKVTYSLSNAPGNISLAVLAKWRQGRYFVERIFQEVKSEIGWDELEARKYRSWIHHTALCALALWFAMMVKWRWNKKFPRDSNLKKELEVEKLPELSVANIRELLISVLPLKTLSCEEAMNLVVIKLVARAKSTRSRIRKHKSMIQRKGA